MTNAYEMLYNGVYLAGVPIKKAAREPVTPNYERNGGVQALCSEHISLRSAREKRSTASEKE